MREIVHRKLRLVTCALLAGLALAVAAEASAADPAFDATRKADPASGMTCSAGSSSTAELNALVDQIRREAAPSAQNDPSAPIVLNGSGYNYGSGNPTLEGAALEFEVRQTR